MTWLEQILHATDELESPKSFWYWSALAAISAVVKDSVWVDRGGAYKLYPNIYVMLLAKSGLRKGKPINFARKLVTKVGSTRVISGRSSIQGILKELSTAQTVPGGRVPLTTSCGFIVASEFTSSLVEDRAALTILTDLYDRIYNEGDWNSLLKMEVFKLKDPTVTFLTGTNEPHFKDFLSERDVHGGFIGRTFLVSETRKHRSNSLIRKLKNPFNEDAYVPYLRELVKLKGEIVCPEDSEAATIYDKWYTALDKVIDDGVDDKTGTLERLGDSVMKVAALLSLSESTNMIINEHHITEAISVCQKLVGAVRKTTLTQGSKQSYAEQKALILQELLTRQDHKVSREHLLQKYWMHFNLDQLEQIMLSFSEARVVEPVNMGSSVVYKMPDAIAEQMLKKLRGE